MPSKIKRNGHSSDPIDRTRLALPEPEFKGVIGKSYQVSKADWPAVPKPPEGAPNVVVILLDDVGFGQVSTFGGGRSRHPHSTSWRPGACVTTVSTRRRSAGRRARASSLVAIITIVASAFSPNGRQVSPATTT